MEPSSGGSCGYQRITALFVGNTSQCHKQQTPTSTTTSGTIKLQTGDVAEGGCVPRPASPSSARSLLPMALQGQPGEPNHLERGRSTFLDGVEEVR